MSVGDDLMTAVEAWRGSPGPAVQVELADILAALTQAVDACDLLTDPTDFALGFELMTGLLFNDRYTDTAGLGRAIRKWLHTPEPQEYWWTIPPRTEPYPVLTVFPPPQQPGWWGGHDTWLLPEMLTFRGEVFPFELHLDHNGPVLYRGRGVFYNPGVRPLWGLLVLDGNNVQVGYALTWFHLHRPPWSKGRVALMLLSEVLWTFTTEMYDRLQHYLLAESGESRTYPTVAETADADNGYVFDNWAAGKYGSAQAVEVT